MIQNESDGVIASSRRGTFTRANECDQNGDALFGSPNVAPRS